MVLRKAAAFQQQQFLKTFKKVVALARVLPGAKRVGCYRVGPRCAPEPKIDAAGKQRLQHLETLGDHERRVIGQHHTTGADANFGRHRRDLPDHDLGC